MKRIALCVLALLVACNDDDKKDNAPKVQTGQFIDSAVQHLHYQTATQSGETDADGHFSYLAGETITFSIGGVVLGTITAVPTVTPFSIFNVTPPTSLADIEAAIESQYLGDVSDFIRAVNLTVFLQALDADGNPDNGIDLSGRNEAYAGASLSFAATFNDFFSHVLPMFVQLYGGGNQSPSVASALSHLYATLQLNVAFDVVSRSQQDTGNNGTINSTVETTYDANGRIASVSRLDSAGTVRTIDANTYDAAGNLLTEVYSSEPAGAGGFHSVMTSTYTYVNGRNTKVLQVATRDGTTARTSTQTFTYDAAGRMTQRTFDDDIVGIAHPISTTAITYDAPKRTVTETRADDGDGDGTNDSSSVYARTVDANGNTTLETHDEDADGVLDSSASTAYTYDAAGRVLQSVYESKDGSGVVTSRYTQRRTFDAAGRIATTSEYSGVDGMGPSDSKYDSTYTFDASGRLIVETDSRLNSGVASSSRDERTYTATGRLATDTRTSRDAGGGVTSVNSDTYTYEAGTDHLLSLRTDHDEGGDGVDQTDVTTYAYVRVINGLNALLGLFGFQVS